MQLPPKVLQHVEVVLRPLAEAWYDHDITMCQIFYSKHHAAERWDLEFGSNTTENL